MESDLSQINECNGEVLKTNQGDGTLNHSGDGPVLNGYTNGIVEKESHKGHREEKDKNRVKHKDKHREKDRDKEKHKDKDRVKEKHKDKDRHRDKEKEHRSSSHKSKDRDKDREKHRDKDKDRESSKHRDKDKEKEQKSSSSSSHKEKDKHRDSSSKHSSSSSKDKEKHKSSSSKEKERSDKDKDRSEKDKDRADKDRDKSDKEKSRSDKEKYDKQKSKDKEKSKSEKDKHHRDKSKNNSSSSTSKDKEKKKERNDLSSKSSSGNKLQISFPDIGRDSVKRKVLMESDEEEEEGGLRIVEDEPSAVTEEDISRDDFQAQDGEDDDYKLDISNIKNEPMYTDYDDEPMEQDSFGSIDVSRVKAEPEDDYEDDMPLSARSVKKEYAESEDDQPLASRKKKEKKRKKAQSDYEEEEEEDFKPKKKKVKKESIAPKKIKSEVKTAHQSPTKKKKEDDQEVWKWWEEEKKPDGVKWSFLEHKGPVFAPPYEPLPKSVKFYYDGNEMTLSEEAEEVATFYARMLEHDYVTKDAFNKNFFHDWRKVMTSKEQSKITDLSLCNFKPMHAYFVQKSEERKGMSKEEKKAIKEQNEQLIEEYGFCMIDGHKEKIGNFKLEPPGLFRGRGEHPKMGMLKKRLNAEDIIINCSKDAKVPDPPPGHKWKEVRHDNTVTWLASWTENVQGQVKYIMLNPSSKLKGEKDWQKYEMARKLAKCVDKIRNEYKDDWKSKEMRIRQRAVALYFIDKLALRAGNEKDEDQADTVGCCSLRVEHITLHAEKDGKEFVVVFDFLGKDSIRYYNEVPVEKRVFKNLQLFMENKKPSDDLFDRLNTTILNKHLNELMDGLTAKVFRTYNASWTLQQQLKELTNPDYSVPEMILAYNRANRAVAILCNHQRSVPKSHQKSMDNIKGKISAKKEAIEEAEHQYKIAKRDAKNGSAKERIVADKAKKKLERLKEQLTKLEVLETDKEENKTIALGTSKLNYLDPRISVAWCKKYGIPIEKIYNKTQRSKFRWAIDMATADYQF